MSFEAGWLGILFGLIAWMLPIIGIARRNKFNRTQGLLLSVCSIGACAISLCLELFLTRYLVDKADWSAVMDIFPTVASAGLFLVVTTMILNAVSIYLVLKRKGA